MNDFYYRKLDAYQLAKQLSIQICQIVSSFPDYERFALSDQLRRAAISIPSNIAEGTGRFALKDRIHFLDYSYGSLCETMCQLEIALELGHITQQTFNDVETLASRVSMTLTGLKKALSDKLNQSNRS